MSKDNLLDHGLERITFDHTSNNTCVAMGLETKFVEVIRNNPEMMEMIRKTIIPDPEKMEMATKSEMIENIILFFRKRNGMPVDSKPTRYEVELAFGAYLFWNWRTSMHEAMSEHPMIKLMQMLGNPAKRGNGDIDDIMKFFGGR